MIDLSAYPVVVDNFDDNGDFASVRPRPEQYDAANLDKAFESRQLGEAMFVSFPLRHTSETPAKLHPSPPPAIHRLDRAFSNVSFSHSSKKFVYSPSSSRIASFSYSPA